MCRQVLGKKIAGLYIGTGVAVAIATGWVIGKLHMEKQIATNYIPCKMMAPIIKKLTKIYEGKITIVFIDVWKNWDKEAFNGQRNIEKGI